MLIIRYQVVQRYINHASHIFKLVTSTKIKKINVLLSVKAVALIFISGRGWTISSAKQGKSDSIYNLVKNFK